MEWIVVACFTATAPPQWLVATNYRLKVLIWRDHFDNAVQIASEVGKEDFSMIRSLFPTRDCCGIHGLSGLIEVMDGIEPEWLREEWEGYFFDRIMRMERRNRW